MWKIKYQDRITVFMHSLSFYEKAGVWFTLTVTSRHLISLTLPRNPTADVKVITDPIPSNIQEIYATSWFLPEEIVTQSIHIVISGWFFFLETTTYNTYSRKKLNLCKVMIERMEIELKSITYAIYSHRKIFIFINSEERNNIWDVKRTYSINQCEPFTKKSQKNYKFTDFFPFAKN